MEPLKVLSDDSRATDQCKRAARRVGLGFHIDAFGYLVSAGYRDEDRVATDEEQVMWRQLVGPIEGVLDAQLREFESCIVHPGPYYLSPEDFATMRQVGRKLGRHAFWACIDRLALQVGYMGTFDEVPIYVSRAIPKGYYLNPGRIIPELNWRPNPDKREVEPELDYGLRVELEADLRPFLTS
jgi:hypothetical protein